MKTTDYKKVYAAALERFFPILMYEATATQTENPVLRSVLEQIATDEESHAALAWRSVAWMLKTYPMLKEAAIREFATARPESPESNFHHKAWGILDSEALNAVAEEVQQQIIQPCAAGLGLTGSKTRQNVGTVKVA